jgi:hypothetical protein
MEARFFPSPRRPDRIWAHQSSCSNGTGGLFPRGKASGAWSWPFTSNKYRGQEYVDLYIRSAISFPGVVLNWLSTGTTSHFTFIWNKRFLEYCRLGSTKMRFYERLNSKKNWKVLSWIKESGFVYLLIKTIRVWGYKETPLWCSLHQNRNHYFLKVVQDQYMCYALIVAFITSVDCLKFVFLMI